MKPIREDSYSLRPVTEEELPSLVEIEKRAQSFPWTMDHFQAELAKPYAHVLVLTDDETDTQLVGYVCVWTLMDEAQLLNIVVDLPYRRMGFGLRILRRVIDLASREGCKRMILDVRKSNAPAIQLYQAQGFRVMTLRKGFYPNGEDAYSMELRLDGGDSLGDGLDF